MPRWRRAGGMVEGLARQVWPALTVAALLRLVAVLAIPLVPISDNAAYDLFAAHLAAGQGYTSGGMPSAEYAPGYPFLLAALYWLGGWDHLWAKLANVAAGTASAWLAYRCGRAAGQPSIGLLACWCVALFPSQVLWAPVLAAENLASPLFLGVLVAFMEGRGWRAAVLGGLLVGWGTLTRPQLEYLPLAGLVVLLALRRWRWWPALRFSVGVWLVAALVVAPWVWRNLRVFHAYVPIATSLGGGLVLGEPALIPEAFEALGRRGLPAEHWFGRDATLQIAPPPEVALARDRLGTVTVWDWARRHPGQFLAHSLARLAAIYLARLDSTSTAFTLLWDASAFNFPEATFYEPATSAARVRAFSPTSVLVVAALVATYYMWILVAAVDGMRRALGGVRRGQLHALALAPLLWVGYYSVTSAVVQGVDRYHMPCIPLLAWYAALAWRWRAAPS